MKVLKDEIADQHLVQRTLNIKANSDFLRMSVAEMNEMALMFSFKTIEE